MDIPESTTKTSTSLPEVTSGRGMKTDSGNVENQSSSAGHSQYGIAGTVIITITLAIFALI